MVKKINIASLRVINTLLCLFEKDLTMSELIFKLKQEGYGPYNNFLVTKCIHTLKACGIDIQKIKDKYCLVNFPIGMKFDANEAQLLYDMKIVSEKFSTEEMNYLIARFFEKLHLPNYKFGIGLYSSPNYNVIKYLKQAYKANAEVIITDTEMNKEECFVRDIKVVDGEYRFITVGEDGVKEINPNKICKAKLLDRKARPLIDMDGVIYELRGRLAERYQLRVNERVLKYKDNGDLVILNEYEDKNVLIQRLLRYDSSCKVISPQEFVKQFKFVVEDSLKNYNIDASRKSKKKQTKEVEKLELRKQKKEEKG